MAGPIRLTPPVLDLPDIEVEALAPAEVPETPAPIQGVTRPDLVRIGPDGEVSEVATLIVGGLVFEDWESVWIQWNWTDPYAQFRFTCAEREPYPEHAAVLQFKPGDPCEIYLGGIRVINGVIIERQVAYDPNSHGVMLMGVSLTWFAARASIIHPTGDFDGKNFLQIAQELISPFGVGIQVIPKIDMTPFKAGATASPGEPLFPFLERLARDRKIIVSSTPAGDFLFIGEHAWPSVGDLIEGENIKKMQCIISNQGLYSEYRTRAQKRANDVENMRKASEQEAKTGGSAVRYSPLLTPIEHPVWSPHEVALRNDTEAMWHEATLIEANVTVYGWFRQAPSNVPSIAVSKGVTGTRNHILWQAGDEITVFSPMALLNGDALKIKTVTWMQDSSSGTQTLLQLVNPFGLNSRRGIYKTTAPRGPAPSQPDTNPPVGPPTSLAPPDAPPQQSSPPTPPSS